MDSTIYTVFLTVAAVFLVAGFSILAWRVVVGPDSVSYTHLTLPTTF